MIKNTPRIITYFLSVSGKEGLCEVRCDPINPMDEGILGHVGFMPDGTSCGSSTNSNWRCLFGKCQVKLEKIELVINRSLIKL